MSVKFQKNEPGLIITQKVMKGDDGGYYVPSVDENGNLTWTPSEIDMPVVESSNIKGPTGTTGPNGVYVGNNEPTDPNIRVWLIPDGQVSDYVMTEKEVKNFISESLEEVENGTY